MFKGLAIAAVLGVLAATPSLADTTLYACTVTQDNGVIPPDVAIGMVDGADTATVSDAYILHEKGQPITASVKSDTEGRLTVSWTLILTNDAQQTTKMLFRAIVLKPSLKFVMTANPQGYANTFRGDGKCTAKVKK